MTRRRATYKPGAGLLFVDKDRLLFLKDIEHAPLEALFAAASDDRPLRSLAAAVVNADFDVPPFVFIEQGHDLRGMVFGTIELSVADPENSLIRGDTADTWSHFQGSTTAVVSSGASIPGFPWIEVGIVRAGAFRWGAAADAAWPCLPASSAARFAGTPEDDANRLSSQPSTSGPATEHRAGMSALTRQLPPSPTPTNNRGNGRVHQPEAVMGWGVSETVDVDSTVDLRPGEVLLEENTSRRTVEARICLDCGHPNPPTIACCRACNAFLTPNGGELRSVAQPTRGVIHLSGGNVERLDMDLLIGRNPEREPLRHHQRAVVHGRGDRSVSRRHIDVRLDGWQVVVINLKADEHTIVESVDGTKTPLPPGVPRTLQAGDTVRYGGSWFRYEEGG